MRFIRLPQTVTATTEMRNAECGMRNLQTPHPALHTPNCVIGRIPYLNCAPFFTDLKVDSGWDITDVSPRQLGRLAETGEVTAGPMSLVDFLRLQDRFERLGPLGIAVRGRVGSAMLFSRKPIRQLDGMTIAVTEETSTTALLLRLLLEQRYHLTAHLTPSAQPLAQDADAMLLIGDEALRFRAANRLYPFEIDVAFEWWLWQHLPFVFAVWAVRKDCEEQVKRSLSHALQHTLAVNGRRLNELVARSTTTWQVAAEDVTRYLGNFIYRLSAEEERAIQQFSRLVHDPTTCG
ncbi:MAG: menaquinone biosynthesis protein [Candidatus Omnitrophica bacterium]|nr:menaquinone biosynthesis protein [Candidatus Omnitrophota bacterium]